MKDGPCNTTKLCHFWSGHWGWGLPAPAPSSASAASLGILCNTTLTPRYYNGRLFMLHALQTTPIQEETQPPILEERENSNM